MQRLHIDRWSSRHLTSTSLRLPAAIEYMKPVAIIGSTLTSGTIEGVPQNQTPSWVQCGPEGAFFEEGSETQENFEAKQGSSGSL